VIIYPAIDIDRGTVARGSGGRGDPAAAAGALVGAGATWLHVVDMGRALGTGDSTPQVRLVAQTPEVQVQLGGGLTDPADVERALGWGIARVAVGVSAWKSLEDLVRSWGPERIAVSVDVRAGAVVSRGPQTVLDAIPSRVLELSVEKGVKTVIYRDLERDGLLDGADLAGARLLIGRGAEVILAGGVASIDEIKEARDAGMAGVIVGRALHEGRFTLEEALACLE